MTATVRVQPALGTRENGASAPSDRAGTSSRPTGSPPLRLLMVSARYLPFMGGVEAHVHEVGKRLAAAGVDLTVLTTDPSGELPPAEAGPGFAIRRVRAWPRGGDYYLAPGVARVVREGGWDLVHVQGWNTLVAPLAMLAARRAGIPYVVTFHSGGHSSRLRHAIRGAQRRAQRPLLRGAAALVGVSRFEADLFAEALGLDGRDIAVIPNGAHLPPALDAAPGPGGPLVVSVGRLERYKGHHRAIAALPALSATHPGARLRVLGGGPYEAELRALAARLGVGDRVEIGPVPPGERAALAAIVGRADLVVLLSDYEAHPIAVMEALALGRPVLAAHTSGLAELADRGLIRSIPVASSPAEIAAAISRSLAAPLIPSDVALPTWEACAAALLQVYRAASAPADVAAR